MTLIMTFGTVSCDLVGCILKLSMIKNGGSPPATIATRSTHHVRTTAFAFRSYP